MDLETALKQPHEMPKMLRQAKLFESASSKKRHEDSSSVCTEEITTGVMSNSGMVQDEDTESDFQHDPASSHEPGDTVESECLSPCCTDKTKSYQPKNKAVLSTLARKGRNFVEN